MTAMGHDRDAAPRALPLDPLEAQERLLKRRVSGGVLLAAGFVMSQAPKVFATTDPTGQAVVHMLAACAVIPIVLGLYRLLTRGASAK